MNQFSKLSYSSSMTSNDHEPSQKQIKILHDDCMELIFAYLTLKEKCELELVSRRWKALMFKYQNNLEWVYAHRRHEKISLNNCLLLSNSWDKNKSSLLAIIKKCPFIEKIDVRLDSMEDVLMMELCGEQCLNLVELVIQVRIGLIDRLIEFGKMFGHKLVRLSLEVKNENIEVDEIMLSALSKEMIQFLSYCPKLEQISMPQLWLKKEIDCDQTFLSKLRRLTMNRAINSNDIKFLSNNQRYARCLTNLIIPRNTSKISNDSVVRLLEVIPKMSQLEEFVVSDGKYLSDKMYGCELTREVTKHCYVTLKWIKLEALNKFSNINDCFSHCPKVTRLDLTLGYLKIEQINNINAAFPNLVELRIDAVMEEAFFENIVLQLGHLEHLKCLSLTNSDYRFRRVLFALPCLEVVYLLHSCSRLKSLEFIGFHGIECEMFKSMIAIAKSRPIIDLVVKLRASRPQPSWWKTIRDENEFNHELKCKLPINLTIITP